MLTCKSFVAAEARSERLIERPSKLVARDSRVPDLSGIMPASRLTAQGWVVSGKVTWYGGGLPR